jgi:myxalamid-type polyketide synthase MxaE and MxaD
MTSESENKSVSTAKRALRALQELQIKLAAIEAARQEPIAIIGMGCRLPGANNLSDFWDMLCQGRSGVTEVPADRWDVDAFFSTDPKARGKISSRWGGFVPGVELFDANFFGISPREAPHVDPRQRLMLEVTWEALEDSGIPPHSLSGSQTGVFVAALSNDYDSLICEDFTRLDSFTGTGTANSIVANRISYFLDLRGPSIALDTACSGSLLTIELACRSLRSGESSLALAGGVSLNLLPKGDIFFSSAGALSPDGKCQAFDHRANGIVRGEGAGVVVLKPLSKAIADGDRIYSVVRGGAINHDGRSNGIMAPNGLAQEAMLQEAYRNAGLSPAKVQFVETHGTGTPLGDPIEVKALGNVLGSERSADFACVIGSVKTNIGHLESAAGVAGVIKTALALFHRQIPPNLHFEEINPLIVLPAFPMSVQTELTRWPSDDRRLVAGVSGFSFGGTNVHLVLEEAPANPKSAGDASAREEGGDLFVLPLSARTPKALKALAREYERFIDSASQGLDAESLCFTSAVKRSHHDFRLALLGASTGELYQALTTWLGDLDDDRLKDHIVPGKGGQERSLRLVFVYSGQGSHFAGMGRELYDKESVFRESLDNVSRLFEPFTGRDLRDEMFATDGVSRINETDCAQPAIFAMQVALTDLWFSWGISPDAVVGQSLGEVAAAYAAGALSLEDAVSIVFHRSRLMRRTAGRGLTAVIGLSRTDTIAEVDGQGDRVSIAGNSSPTSTVIAGDPQSVESIVRRMQGRDVFARIIENVDVAFHSVQMLPLRDELERALIEVSPQPTNVAFYSTVTGELCEGPGLNAHYWARNLCEPFCFADVVGHLARNGYETFLEISPHSVLSGAVQQSLIRQSIRGEAIPSLTRGMDEALSIKRALAKIYVEGHNVDWKKQYRGNAEFVNVPGYVWQKERYWVEQIEGGSARRSVMRPRAAGEHPFVSPGARLELGSGQSVWELELSPSNVHYVRDHRIQGAIVVPGAAYLDMALAAALQARPGASVVLEDVLFNRAMILADDEVRRMQLVLDPSVPGSSTFHVYSKSTSSELSGGASADPDRDTWTEHASSRAVISSQGPARQRVSLEDLRASFSEELSADDHYREMESRQFTFGPAFRAIRRLWRRDVESLSRIELPREAGDTTPHVMHPVVIDAGFQTIAATMSLDSGQTYLPKSIKRVQVAGPSESHLWCHVRLVQESEARLDTLTADLTYLNDQGEIVLEIEGLILNRLDVANIETTIADSLLITRWKPAEPGAETEASSTLLKPGHFLILADRGGTGEALSVELGRLDQESRVVFSENRSGIEAIVREAALSERTPLLGVIHLWGLDCGELQGVESLDRANELGPLSILATLRGLIASGNAKTKLWCVTQNGQRPGEGPIEVLQSGLWGMGRALAVEHPELWGGLIDVDSGESEQARAARIISELTSSDDEREVAWRDGVRLVPRLARWEGRRGEGIAVQCRADSSYLVTGGLSGLGLEAAKWLIEQGARRLIVAGRRGVPARTEWQRQEAGSEEWERVESLKELERMGAAIEYWSVDVSNEGAMRQLWEREEAEGRPPIRGIVHAAGVLDDVLAMRMSDESCLRVQEGKVKGALVLDELSRGRGLDFYLAYSSVSGVMGQVGQANYGAANAYLDGLMAKRRERGEAGLSIAWGPWAEVGMWARPGGQSYERDGLRPITPEMGREILKRAFHADEYSLVVLSADFRKLRSSSLLAGLRNVEKRRCNRARGGCCSRHAARPPACVAGRQTREARDGFARGCGSRPEKRTCAA